MLLFLSTGSAHYDSVNSKNTGPSDSIQMDVKIPVQPSNFDSLHKGALVGAPKLIELSKIYIYQQEFIIKFIPSPGTTI